MSVVVVAHIHPLPDHRDAVITAYREAIPQVHAEHGCELYALHTDGEQLVMIEKWADRDALAEHAAGPVLAALRPKTKGMFSEPTEVVVLDPVSAGEPALGTL